MADQELPAENQSLTSRELNIRPLTDTEIDSLAELLGNNIDRKYLVHWISQSITDTVRSARLGTPRQIRDSLLEVERGGREWLKRIDESRVRSLLTMRANLPEFRATTVAFCDRVTSLVQELNTVVGPGRSRTPPALEAFVEHVIGLAKKAKVLPSTPSRRADRQAHSPAFFQFLVGALRIARQVIKTSKLPEDVKAEALSRLQYTSTDALIKVVVKARGRIGNYRATPHGLVEWE